MNKLKKTFNNYPPQFWYLMLAKLIDLTGAFLIFPFLSLYFTEKFNVALSEVAITFMLWSVSGMLGQVIGGALADRFGRKKLVIFGLIMSALTSLALAFVPEFKWVYLAIAIGGTFSSIANPAHQAMVPDLLPPEQLSEGYGVSRVVGNLAYAIGPAIGGLLANLSYTLLFGIDVLTSVITAIFIARFLKETQSETAAAQTKSENLITILRGYLQVLKDKALLVMFALLALVGIVYWQWYFSVPIFMRDTHQMPPYIYGSLMSWAGVMVVLFQIPLTRKLKQLPPLLVLFWGSVSFMLGFGLFTFITGLLGFVMAFSIITVGEMIFFPTQQTVVAKLAPESLRARYMAAAGIAFSIPNLVGPLVGGYFMDHFAPGFIWYAASAAALLGGVLFFIFHLSLKKDHPLVKQ